MSPRASEIVADLERARDEQEARAEQAEARLARAAERIAPVLAELGLPIAAEARLSVTLGGSTIEEWADAAKRNAQDAVRASDRATAAEQRAAQLQAQVDAIPDLPGDDADAPEPTVEGKGVREWAAKYHDLMGAVEAICVDLGISAPEESDTRERTQGRIIDAIGDLRVNEEALRDAGEEEQKKGAGVYTLDLAEVDRALPLDGGWSLEEIARRMQLDSLFWSRLFAGRDWRWFEREAFSRNPPRAWSDGVTAQPPKSDPPAAADKDAFERLCRFGSLCFEDMAAEEIKRTVRGVWARFAGEPDREGKVRAELQRLAEDPASTEVHEDDAPPSVKPDEPTTPAAPDAKRKRNETEGTIAKDWLPETAQVKHGMDLGFTEEQVRNLALAFRAEVLKSGETASRWGARFRGYLTDAAKRAKKEAAK